MKGYLPRVFIIIILVVVVAIGSNVSALFQMMTYLPIVVKNPDVTTSPSPSPTTVTPTVTATQPTQTTGNVEIRDIFFNGTGPNEPDEYVVIENDDSFPIQLKDWTLRDEADHIFTFPSYVIQPNEVCRVYTNENHPEWCGFNYGSGSAIWNNGGDTAYLRDSNGTLIDDYNY